MKIRFLMTGLLGLITAASVAQTKEVTTAQTEYNKYDQFKTNKAMATLATNSLNAAKTAIDKAVTMEKNANSPLAFAIKSSVYGSMALNDTVPATSTPLFVTAEEALKKAKELDKNGENKKVIETADFTLAQYQLNKGVKEYGAKKYDLAYKSFDYYRQVLPEDTNAIYYTGLAAANAADKDPSLWAPAIANYKKLLTTNYSGKMHVYQDLSNFYLYNKDTTNAIKILTEASEKYPTDAALGKKVIEMNLQTGKQAEVISRIEKTIANDPKNKTLYYYAGITYTQVADQDNKKIEALKKASAPAKSTAAKSKPGTKPAPAAATPATSPELAALYKDREEYLNKAEDMYKKALAIDPDYFEANLNLGYVLINPAIDLFNSARNFPVSQQKEYNAAMAKANTLFDTAKPYLQKAVDLQPKNTDALNNLRTYYLGKNDMAHANEIKKRIEDIQSAQK